MTGRCRLVAAASLAALAAGCATPDRQVRPGITADELLQRAGRPTAEHRLPSGGRRLEYGGGTYGRATYMFDFDAGGRLATVEQVRTEARFDAIRPGMTAAEVLSQIGSPSATWNVRHQRQTVWSYRYETPFCQWFMVGMNPTQRVEDVAYGPDPLCARGDSTIE